MTVLYVEDNDDDIIFFARALKQVAPTVPWRLVVDLEQAKCYLMGDGAYQDRDRYPFPTLVVCSAKLPDGDGLDLLKWTHSRPGLSPLLFCLFDWVPEHLRESLPNPTRQQYVQKPAQLREWAAVVQEMLAWSEAPERKR